MEEKEVKKEQAEKKFTYEQLSQIAASLSSQVQQLSAKLNEANMFNMFKRLDYCFKVLETAPKVPATFFSEDFVERCAKEIEEAMNPLVPEEEVTTEE